MDTSNNLRGIAIIGMACRFPGANDLETFWQNLRAGKESVTFFTREELANAGIPADMLDQPGFVPAAPMIDDVDQFDASFFGFTGREASVMDPQQRLFLEVAWEAFENAGHHPESLRRPVGVFAGSGGVVTSYLAAHHGRAPDLLGPTGSVQHIGNDKDFLATRVSYKLDLTGPSINIQTACSTSLVAIHLACRSLLDGECDLALAGASTIRFPHKNGYVYRSEDILSPDGHCRAFDARAQGTIFGSGVGAVLLRPLRDAIAAGDHIYAVIKGSAINNDGGQKVSYGASSVPGQATAMIEAITLADIAPDTIQYVECHATGTTVGDPLEVQALTRAFRVSTQRKNFCAIGSVKTNIGHLEQTAGMAALIKTVLALSHREIPPSINFESPNPKLGLTTSPFYVQTTHTPWDADPSHPRRAGVNGLGLGGTNAFLVLEEAPRDRAQERTHDERPMHVLALSARSDAALEQSAQRLVRHLAEPTEVALADVCFTASTSRSAFEHRLAISARSIDELRTRLTSVGSEKPGPGVSIGHGKAKPIVFLFTGQGAQYPGMTAKLYRTQPVFRAALDECNALSRPHLERPLFRVLFAEGEDAELIHETAYTQIGLFAVEYALAMLWKSWGVEPAAVMGHSVGEVTAACVAGAMDLGDALKLIACRGRAMQALPRTGGMMAVFAPEARVRELIAPYGELLSIAASNAPTNTVVSGKKDALALLGQVLGREGIAATELVVSHAFHSALMDPMLDKLEAVAAEISFRRPKVKLVANLTGTFTEEAPTARYWREHAREGVRFAQGMWTLQEAGYTVFLEIGPGSTLLGLGRQCIQDPAVQWLPSLSRQRDEWDVLSETLRTLYVGGHAVDWIGFDAPYRRDRVPLPTYPFQRKRYWISEATVRPSTAVHAEAGHPLLGTRVRSTLKDAQFEAYYSLDALPYLDDHRIFGLPVLPTTAALELAVAGGRTVLAAEDVAVESFLYREALVLPEDGQRIVHLVVTPDSEDRVTFKILSTEDRSEARWIHHIDGTLRRGAATPTGSGVSLEQARERCTAPLPIDRYYPAIRAMGLEYGPAFRGIVELWQGPGEALSHVRLPEHVSERPYAFQPAFLDACLHVYAALAEAYGDFTTPPDDLRRTFLPISMERFTAPAAAGTREAWVHAIRRPGATAETMVVDIHLHSNEGELLTAMEGLQVRRLTVEAMQPSVATLEPVRGSTYVRTWNELPAVPPAHKDDGALADRWLVFVDRGGVGEALANELRRLGEVVDVVSPDVTLPVGETTSAVTPDDPKLFHRLIRDYFGVPGVSFRNVVYLWGLDASPAASGAAVGGALRLVQALSVVNSVTGATPRLWLATRNAQGPTTAIDRHAAPIWAVGSAMALRQSDLWGGIIDLERRAAPDVQADARELLDEMLSSDGEDQVARRGGQRFAPRLSRSPVPPHERGEPLFRRDAAYLLAGALAGDAFEVAAWMVAEGARHLLLAPDEALDDAARARVAGLSTQGVDIELTPIERIVDPGTRPALTGIFYFTPTPEGDLLDLADWRAFAGAIEASVGAAERLDRASRTASLEHFVLFSTIHGWIGSETRTGAAAGSLILSAVAHERRAEGLPATVIHRGPWQGAGREAEAARGLPSLAVAEALAAVGHALRNDIAELAVADVDWAAWTQVFRGGVPALYSGLNAGGPRKRREPRADDDPRLLLARIQAAPVHERRGVIIEVVRKQVTDVLGNEELVPVDAALVDFGLDSLVSVNLVNRLEPALGVSVPLAKLLQGASVERLVDDLFPTLSQANAA